jgi:hypothetical protein
MTLLMMFATAGKGDLPPPVVIDTGGGYYLQPQEARTERVLPRQGFAPGAHFVVRAVLAFGGARGAGAAAGGAFTAAPQMRRASATGAANAQAGAHAPAVQMRAGVARVEIRVSMDELAAILLAVK